VKAAVAEGAGLYADAARSLAETGRCRVILCARPEEIREHDSEPPAPGEDADGEEQAATEIGRDFHDMLKAQALGLACPLQVMRRETWEGAVRRGDAPQPLQDEATRAWNLHIALYYKAGGTPWRMPRRDSDLAACYIGVSFYRTTDGEELPPPSPRSSTSAATASSSAAAPRQSPRPTSGPTWLRPTSGRSTSWS